jgi:hypothetical protein
MITTRRVSVALAVTAVVNVVGGGASLLSPSLHARLFLPDGVVLDGLTLRYHVMVWCFVVAMGAGYAVAARDPARQTALLFCAGFGKLAAPLVWAEMWMSGLGSPLMLGGIAFDAPLGVLFLAYAWPRLTDASDPGPE